MRVNQIFEEDGKLYKKTGEKLEIDMGNKKWLFVFWLLCAIPLANILFLMFLMSELESEEIIEEIKLKPQRKVSKK